MRRATTFALGLCSTLLVAGPALAQMACGEHTNVTGTLHQDYRETKKAIGLTEGGHLVEVFAGESGTWTILLVTPEGVACSLTAGKNWEWVAEPPRPSSSSASPARADVFP